MQRSEWLASNSAAEAGAAPFVGPAAKLPSFLARFALNYAGA